MPSAQASVLEQFKAPLVLRSYTVPAKPGPGAALIRTEMAGICGTDVHLWKGELPIGLPVILGHETVGRIEALGEGLESDWTGQALRPGDRVTWNPSAACGTCYYCAEKRLPTRCTSRRAYGIGYRCDQAPHFLGGYAEFHYLHPRTTIFRLPDDLPTESIIGAGCALNTAIHGVERTGIGWQDLVVVQGAGPVGIAALAVAKSAGAGEVIVIGAPAHRLAMARRFGADHVISVEEVREPADRIAAVRQLTRGYGADVVLECVGAPAAVVEGVEMCRDGGKYLVLGHYCDAGPISFNPHIITRKQLQVFGSWSSEPRHLKTALDFLRATQKQFPFADMVSHRFRLEQANEALATTARWESAKSVLVPVKPPDSRLESIDLLRGLVMVLMALDHTRDFFHHGPFEGVDPLDFATTTAPLFLTRWITHYCAPVFVFLAGVGAFLSTTRGKSKGELSWFLASRGLWLIVLELTWIRWAGWAFAINLHEHWGIVIWAIGWSMIALAVLVHLPLWAIAGFGLGMMATHNAFDGVTPESWGRWHWLWRVLHAGGKFGEPGGVIFGAGYPLIPWIGVMATGYSFGPVLQLEPARRRRLLLVLGTTCTLLFIALRATNRYGNPEHWSSQKNGLFTLLSFLDCHKYPPSLCYLLMTLGPALLVLAWLDHGTPRFLKPFLVFGRVPLFYYLLHLPLIHALAVIAAWMRFGRADWLHGSPPGPAPPGAGFDLPVVYGVWLLVVVALFPVCRWFADLKRRRRDPWLSYL